MFEFTFKLLNGLFIEANYYYEFSVFPKWLVDPVLNQIVLWQFWLVQWFLSTKKYIYNLGLVNVTQDTVEERMQQVQARKQRMIAGALTEEEVRTARIEELKMLFR